MSKLTKLAAALDEDNFDWLQRENAPIARAVEEEVKAGVTPQEIGGFMSRHIGPDRSAFIARVVSAARHVEASKN